MLRRAQILLATTAIVLLFLILKHNQYTRSSPPLPRSSYELDTDDEVPVQTSRAQKPVVASVPAPAEAQKPLTATGPSYIFALGDSYTTYGFESDGTPPSSTNPLGNRVPENDTSSAAELVTSTPKWLDFLISDYSPPETLVYNYGRGASTIDDEVVPPHFWGAKSMVRQANELFETVGNKDHKMYADWHGDNSALVVWFGINDVSNTAEEEKVDLKSLYTRVAESYVKVLDRFYDAGGRYFLLLGLPPIDCTPQLQLMGAPHTFAIATASQIFNTSLTTAVEGWASGLSTASVKVMDTQAIFHRVLSAQADDATCQTDGKADSDCLWVDMFHPAPSMQKVVAEEVGKALRAMGLWTAGAS